MHHFDAGTQTALAREHAELLRRTMQASRRPKPDAERRQATCNAPRPLLEQPGTARRAAI